MDLKLQFSSMKNIDKNTYHTCATSKFRVKYILSVGIDLKERGGGAAAEMFEILPRD